MRDSIEYQSKPEKIRSKQRLELIAESRPESTSKQRVERVESRKQREQRAEGRDRKL